MRPASTSRSSSDNLNPQTRLALERGIDLKRLPHHIALIMDGNGRWAQERGLPRVAGHKAGVDALRETITTCVRLGIEYLSVYAFSTENWGRPQEEVDYLMHLFAKTLIAVLPLFKQENVRLTFLGDIEALPQKTREIFHKGLSETSSHTGMVLALAVNYGARAEIVRAARMIAQATADNKIQTDEIDAQLFSHYLYTTGMPDPELLIRTSGEMRLSNFLLFQLAYAELYFCDTYWPDFTCEALLEAISSFQCRHRRFGKIKESA